MGQIVYELTTDIRQISPITSSRVLVSAALLYTYTAHFVFIGIANFFRKDISMQSVHDMGRRLVLYGIAALLSINFLQYGIYNAILAWFLMINVVIIQAMFLMRGVDERSKYIAICIYYCLIAIWFLGIAFFYMFNALNPIATVN